MPQHYTIIIKKHPEGYHYVPFDDDPSEEAAHHRKAMLGHLIDQGHSIEPIAGTRHVKLTSGPHARP